MNDQQTPPKETTPESPKDECAPVHRLVMHPFRVTTEPTIEIRLYLAGDVERIRETCRAYCFNVGLCVTVRPCDYIYTGGEEAGAEIGLVNYPRFPTNLGDLRVRAAELALRLVEACHQWSVLMVDPVETNWITRRPTEDA